MVHYFFILPKKKLKMATKNLPVTQLVRDTIVHTTEEEHSEYSCNNDSDKTSRGLSHNSSYFYFQSKTP